MKNSENNTLKWRILEVIYKKDTAKISTIICFVLLGITLVISFIDFIPEYIKYIFLFVTFFYVIVIDIMISAIRSFGMDVAYKNNWFIVLFSNENFWGIILTWLIFIISLYIAKSFLVISLVFIVVGMFMCKCVICPAIASFFRSHIKH